MRQEEQGKELYRETCEMARRLQIFQVSCHVKLNSSWVWI